MLPDRVSSPGPLTYDCARRPGFKYAHQTKMINHALLNFTVCVALAVWKKIR